MIAAMPHYILKNERHHTNFTQAARQSEHNRPQCASGYRITGLWHRAAGEAASKIRRARVFMAFKDFISRDITRLVSCR